MVLPVRPVTIPSNLAGQQNGRLPSSVLTPISSTRLLESTAARSWKAMTAAATAAGIPWGINSAYRSWGQQDALFRSRYRSYWFPLNGGSRWCNGRRWWKLPGVPVVACPGTSNHGWGLAVDVANAGTSGTSTVRWLLKHADLFGFSWEVQSEPWHVRYYSGDRIPQATLDYESSQQVPVPAPPPTTPADNDEESEMFLVRNTTTGAVKLLIGGEFLDVQGPPIMASLKNTYYAQYGRELQSVELEDDWWSLFVHQ